MVASDATAPSDPPDASRASADPEDDASAAVPAPLRRFVDLFNREEFWESHEALEDAWRENDSEFYHGLILYASAFVHAQRGTRHGILAQLEKARDALERYRPAYLGIDVDGILEHAGRCRRIVEALPEEPDEPWARLVPFPRLEPRAHRIRGDEPELG